MSADSVWNMFRLSFDGEITTAIIAVKIPEGCIFYLTCNLTTLYTYTFWHIVDNI